MIRTLPDHIPCAHFHPAYLHRRRAEDDGDNIVYCINPPRYAGRTFGDIFSDPEAEDYMRWAKHEVGRTP